MKAIIEEQLKNITPEVAVLFSQKSSTVSPPLVMKLNSVGRWNSSRYAIINSVTCSHTASGLTTCGLIKLIEEID